MLLGAAGNSMSNMHVRPTPGRPHESDVLVPSMEPASEAQTRRSGSSTTSDSDDEHKPPKSPSNGRMQKRPLALPTAASLQHLSATAALRRCDTEKESCPPAKMAKTPAPLPMPNMQPNMQHATSWISTPQGLMPVFFPYFAHQGHPGMMPYSLGPNTMMQLAAQ